ncbi:GPW/gp25 family protein [Nocardia sp. NPDC050710]|uniref:GPW/gp25 family protein n=1 Tax=Nocardia sp. NPDC050710 TaxID=3157220 RepID=UPI0033EFE3D5
MATGTGFPFDVNADGVIDLERDEAAGLRGKIIQVLFTTPGERVNQPEFGCGLLNLVFDPNNEIMAAAIEFTVGQALTRWLGDEIVVGGVDVRPFDETVTVEVAYLRRRDLSPQRVRLRFG